MTNLLKIDTSSNQKIILSVEADGKKDTSAQNSTFLKSEVALPAIEKLIKKNNLNIEDIDAVEVNKGPGSFTGLRVGIAIANALGFLLKIPVNARRVGELEEPVYNG